MLFRSEQVQWMKTRLSTKNGIIVKWFLWAGRGLALLQGDLYNGPEFSNRSRNRWTSDSVTATSPFFILTAQSVPSRTKRRSVTRGMPRRLAAWLKVKISSAGSVVSGGANLLPFRRRVVPAGLGRARQRASQSLDTLYAGRSRTEMQAALSLAAGWCCFWRIKVLGVFVL